MPIIGVCILSPRRHAKSADEKWGVYKRLLETWKLFPSTIQENILEAIKGDIRKKLAGNPKPADDESDAPPDIGDVSTYAQDLQREIQANQKVLSRKRRRQADEGSLAGDEEDDHYNAMHLSSASFRSSATEVDDADLLDVMEWLFFLWFLSWLY